MVSHEFGRYPSRDCWGAPFESPVAHVMGPNENRPGTLALDTLWLFGALFRSNKRSVRASFGRLTVFGGLDLTRCYVEVRLLTISRRGSHSRHGALHEILADIRCCLRIIHQLKAAESKGPLRLQ